MSILSLPAKRAPNANKLKTKRIIWREMLLFFLPYGII